MKKSRAIIAYAVQASGASDRDQRPRVTKETWVYDLRSNQKFSQRQNQITSEDLVDFVRCCKPGDRAARKETERFRRFNYEEVISRPKASLDISWLPAEGDVVPRGSPQQLLKMVLTDLSEAMKEFAKAETLISK